MHSATRTGVNGLRNAALGTFTVLACGCGEEPGGATTVIEPSPIISLQITPDTTIVLEGQTVRLGVTVRDAGGADREESAVAWESTNPQVASVSPDGLVTALQLGKALIVGTVGHLVDSASIDVRVLFSAVSAGVHHSCGVSTIGNGYCWGSGGDGRLGNGATDVMSMPVPVRGGLRFRQVEAGYRFSCGLTNAPRRVYCWGINRSGQLGNGDKVATMEPGRVVGEIDFATVTVHEIHACGLEREGAAYCWGADWRGQLGDGPQPWDDVPLRVAGNLWLLSLDAGKFFTCGVAESGGAYCWGDNQFGQLGRNDIPDNCLDFNGDPVACIPVPAAVPGVPPLESVAAGGRHACGLGVEGSVYCWGANDRGQLGDGSSQPRRIPVLVAGTVRFVSLTAGDQHTCGISDQGRAYCWGDNGNGALGTSSTFENCDGRLCSTRPIRVSGEHSFQLIDAGGAPGGSHTCAVTREHEAFCWGQNSSGQLGIGSRSGNSFLPVRVLGQP